MKGPTHHHPASCGGCCTRLQHFGVQLGATTVLEEINLLRVPTLLAAGRLMFAYPNVTPFDRMWVNSPGGYWMRSRISRIASVSTKSKSCRKISSASLACAKW